MKITIFGVGLIGGSLALCFKDIPGVTVVGHSPNEKSVQTMLDKGVVHHATTSMSEAVREADFIFLCVPVSMLETYLEQLTQLPLKSGCIITDVGSTKASIAEFAKQLKLEDIYFIGGHPMAGSERSGIEAASYLLFENAYYVLTPDSSTPIDAVNQLTELLKWTRAQVIHVDPDRHDQIVGAISHLPHIIAVALVNQICDYHEQEPLYKSLAAGGFRDITRIASSDPVIWRDILINNKKVLLELLSNWNDQISDFVQLLEDSNGDGIEVQFKKANQFRKGIRERRKGIIAPQYDIYLDIPDHPGVIGAIATELGNHQINLSNVEIIESREQVPGICRLSFRSSDAADQAIELLQSKYSVHQL
ncbi:prephenate dehydrogenase [Paenibacillus albiflavus]|uniref:Prephenate dehydrogenase n=1 Tax=Paenibacillus albiflavus TaxID=2545760 RepID=A0A4V2WPY0_9BACL|nr:prephenate dehydrogenase [Paenibacillus albiflavus]TCZ81202.1 prephenate dehydrogenase [Paenibacillus albiflavus]